MAKPSGLEMMPEAMKIRKIREMELEIDSLKGRILEAVVEFDKLQEQNADLVAALEEAKFWMEGQHSTVFGDCGVCGSESPYHHGKCPKAQVEQALAKAGE